MPSCCDSFLDSPMHFIQCCDDLAARGNLLFSEDQRDVERAGQCAPRLLRAMAAQQSLKAGTVGDADIALLVFGQWHAPGDAGHRVEVLARSTFSHRVIRVPWHVPISRRASRPVPLGRSSANGLVPAGFLSNPKTGWNKAVR